MFYNKKTRTWKTPRVLIVNSKSIFKGSEIFEEVFPHLSENYELYVIGNAVQFVHHAVNVQLFPYFEKRESLNDLFNDVDILIFPSRAEICPLTILMAMSCGVCVIASNVGGIPEMLDAGCGIAFERKNAEELTTKLTGAIKNIDATRETGTKASLRVKEIFDVNIMYNHYKTIYQQLLKGKNETSIK